jgi:cysteinyl-tRNA synthetase
MGLRLHNTLSNKIEEFRPLKQTVSIYACGLTVQGPPHVGHIRAYIVRDVLVRWLEHLGYQVKTLENFTDIDDKIIEKQKELKKDWRVIAQDNINIYLDAIKRLNIKPAAFYPRASQHIEEIIELVTKLIEKGFAYERGGDVYFKVRAFKDYGRLSKKSIDELLSGARIAPTEHKTDPLDFTLWKAAKPGEPCWLSPWGKGRPGWHIECSAMSMHYLGETFDIHMGGEDLIFPHHENEIAQAVAATGNDFARYWLHNGWVTLGGEKMAKSTGHYYLIKDLLDKAGYHPNVIRLYLLKTQYRNQIEFSQERLDEAKAAYLRIITYIHGFGKIDAIDMPLMTEQFTEAMDDDLNTPKALGIIFDLIKQGYEKPSQDIAASVKYYLNILGFTEDVPQRPLADIMVVLHEVKKTLGTSHNALLEKAAKDLWDRLEKITRSKDFFDAVVNILLDIRNQLRAAKDYEHADLIRTQLAQKNIQILDLGDRSTFRVEMK